MLGIGCDKGTENDEKGSANLELPHVALETLALLLENIEPVASKASLRGYATTVVHTGATFPCGTWLKKGLNVENISCKAFRGWQTGSEHAARLRSQGIEQTRQ